MLYPAPGCAVVGHGIGCRQLGGDPMQGTIGVVGARNAGAARGPCYHIQVLDRTLDILNVLAEVNQSLGPAELARRVSLHKTTTHRLLMALEHLGFVRREPRQGKYGLGVKLFELGSRAVARFELRERAEPFLRRLVDETRETAHVCVLDGTEMVSIANVEGTWTMRSPSTVGRRTPVYCTSVGKAVIAFLSDDVLDQLIERLTLKPFTPRTLVTLAALKAELARVRDRGFAVDDEEIEQGLRCVGAPIRNHTGLVVAAISVAGPAFRLTDQRLPETARAVKAAARDISREMGYSGREERDSGERDGPARVSRGRPVLRKEHDREAPRTENRSSSARQRMQDDAAETDQRENRDGGKKRPRAGHRFNAGKHRTTSRSRQAGAQPPRIAQSKRRETDR